MPDIFADTFGLAQLIDIKQSQHSFATSVYRQTTQQGRKLVTTNYVIAELVALLTSPLHIARPKIITSITNLRTSKFIRIIHMDVALDEHAWQLLVEQPDKNWSLADCASFVVMRQRGISEALTSDHHFE